MSGMAQGQDPTYLYIAGRGHSGTTLLGVLLGNHPEVCGVGELMYFPLQCFRDERTRWVGRCGCGARPFDCEFWGPVIEAVEKEYGKDLRNHPFDWRISDAGIEEEYREKAIVRAPYSWMRNKIWRAWRKLGYSGVGGLKALGRLYTPQAGWMAHRAFMARCIASQTGCRAIADISKDYLDMRDVYAYSALPTRILFTTRDCRANVWSQVRMYCDRHGQEARDSAGQVIARAAKDWARVNRKILRILDGIPETDWLHVRYEDICRDTGAELERVLEFSGLVAAAGLQDVGQEVQHTIAGNRMRFTGLTRGVREDLAWHENLRPDELDMIASICGPVASGLGYDL